MNQLEIAYAAGLFDGEGYVGIGKHVTKTRPNRMPGYQIQCKVSMVDMEAIDLLKSLWGGKVYDAIRRKPTHKNLHQWVLLDNECTVFLKDILPFLRVKKERATIALAFQEHKTVTMPRGKFHRMPDDIRTIRESFYQQMKALNYRGVKVQ